MFTRTALPGLFSLFFVSSASFFWYFVSLLYRDPFSWMSFDAVFNTLLLLIGLSWMLMLTFAGVLDILKPDPLLSKALYGISAAAQWIFIPFSVSGFAASVIFFVAFAASERNTRALFHNSIRLDFWEPFSRSFPMALSLLTFIVGFVAFEGSRSHLDSFRITLPAGLVENTVNAVLSPQVKGEQTSIPVEQITDELLAMARIREPEAPRDLADSSSQSPAVASPESGTYPGGFDVDRFITDQLREFGISDPAQQEFIKKMIQQRIAANGYRMPGDTPSGYATVSTDLTRDTTLPVMPSASSSPSVSREAFGGLTPELIQSLGSVVEPGTGSPGAADGYRNVIVSQAQTLMESQLEGIVRQFRPVIPFFNALSIFFLLSVLHLPVLYTALFLLNSILKLLRKLKVITVVTVKMDVERLAW